jgi:DNA-binding NarL/FixJ family response regulator
MRETESTTGESSGRETARIMIVDDFPVLRQGLRLIIDAQPDMMVCAEASNADEGLALTREYAPHVALVDISLEGPTNGIELTRMINEMSPQTRVCILSMHQNVAYAKRCFAAGAAGYAMKSEPPPNLLAAIRRVLSGKTYASTEISSKLIRDMVDTTREPKGTPVARLSNRELTIFELVGNSRTGPQIAEQLQISVKTVNVHFSNIRRKLNGLSATELRSEAEHWLARASTH